MGAQPHVPFTEGNMPLQQKRDLCIELLGEFGARNVTERGSELLHSCILPFGNHPNGDRTPSAQLNFEKLCYSCWVCGGGGFLWWVATMRNDLSAHEAAAWIRSRTGSPNTQGATALLAFIEQALNITSITAEPPPVYDARVLDKWAFIHPYLTEMRHVQEQNIIDMKVGYGRVRVPTLDQKYIDSERIIIPHFWDGKLVGWQSRRLGNDGTAKYINTPLLPKDTTIYNYDKHADRVVIVESPMSVLARRHQTHIEATFGAEVTARQLGLLSQHGVVIIWMDNDHAGWKATEVIGEYMIQRMPNVMVVNNPWTADPADLDDAEFDNLLSTAVVSFVLWRRPNPTKLKKWESHHDTEEIRIREDTR